MTIHSDHPFLPPEDERSPLRRFRGRLVAPVSLWTAYAERRPVGWTVSSMLVVDGPEATLLGLLDPEADIAAALQPTPGRSAMVAVSLLGWRHRGLPDAFAGLAPAPGGPFRLAEWRETPYGPALADTPAWLGAEVVDRRPVGWSTLITARIRQIEVVDTTDDLLGHVRGRYVPVSP